MAGICRFRTVVSPLSRRFIGISKTRSYGCAAAQVQYDYDSCEDDEEMSDRFGGRRRVLDPVVDMDGCVSGRGVQWAVIGEPGAKKHVYAERLSKLLEVPHISMGSLVRQELNPLSSLYKQIANAVNQGKLVPEDIIFGLLTKRLEEGYCRGETGFILDGIPRTRIQAEILDQIADVDLVVNLKCNEEHLVNNKHIGPATASSHQNFHAMCSSMSNGSTLNLLKPNDKHHFDAEQRKQLEEYYREQQKLLDFKVAGPPGETWKGLLAALHLQHVDAVNSTQKLTARFNSV